MKQSTARTELHNLQVSGENIPVIKMEQSLGSQEIAAEQKHQAKSSKSRADSRDEGVDQVELENRTKIHNSSAETCKLESTVTQQEN